MEININSEKMYNLLSKNEKEGLKIDIENLFLKTKSLEEIIKFYIDEATKTEESNLIIKMYFLMLHKIINGEEEYVKHIHELVMVDKTDPFRLPADKLIGVFYPNGDFDINIKSTIAKGLSYLSINTGSSSNTISSLTRTINFSDLCVNKNKTFSHDSIKEIIEVTKILMINYPEFSDKIFGNKTTQKHLEK